MSDQMQQRRDTSANWAASTKALAAGELGRDTDLKRWKVGTGALWANTEWEPTTLVAGRIIDDAAIAADATCLRITASDYGSQITFAATTAQNITVVANISTPVVIPVVQIYLTHATAFPTIVAESGGVGDMRVYAPSGATGLEQYGYMALQMNSQASPYPGGDWRVDISAAGGLAANSINSATTVIDVSAAAAPSSGQVLTAVDPTHATWQTPAAGASSAQLLQSYNIPVIMPPDGNVTDAVGGVQFGVALPEAYTDGAWMYFQAGNLKAGSAAGIYWYVGSTTTAGVVYQNTYVPGTNLPTKPASATAFTDTVAAAFSGTSGVNLTAFDVSKPANALGKDGRICVEVLVRMTNSANVKNFSLTYGGTTLFTAGSPPLTSTASRAMQTVVQNCGTASVQRGQVSWLSSTTSPIAVSAVNDASVQTITGVISKVTAAEAVVLQRWDVRVEKVN